MKQAVTRLRGGKVKIDVLAAVKEAKAGRSGAREWPADFLNQWLRWDKADGATLNLIHEKTEQRHAV